MKVRAPRTRLELFHRPYMLDAVVVQIAGLELSLTYDEAFNLADRLVDIAERRRPRTIPRARSENAETQGREGRVRQRTRHGRTAEE